MYIQWRDETNKGLGYFLMDDDGSEIHQAHVREQQWDRAKRKKVSIDAVVLEDAAQKLGKEAKARPHREVKIVRVEHSEHDHDDRYLLALPEHDHPPHEHDHPHGHDDIGRIEGDLKAHEMSNAESFRLLDKALIEHKHPEHAPVVHQHADLRAGIDSLRADLAGFKTHEHADVPYHEHKDFDARLKVLEANFADLNVRLAANAQELRNLIDEQATQFRDAIKALAGAKHEHPEYASRDDLDRHIETVGKETSLRILSKEEVAGKTRLIVEEVS